MKSEDKKINELVDLIDEFMCNQGGHLNVSFNFEKQKLKFEKLQLERQVKDCKNACFSATLMEGIEEESK